MQKPALRTGRTDWARLKAFTEEEIEAMAIADRRELGEPDEMPTDGWFNGSKYPKPRAIREALGLSQREFAARFGLSIKTVQHWEQMRTNPDRAALVMLKTIELAPGVVAGAVDAMRAKVPTR